MLLQYKISVKHKGERERKVLTTGCVMGDEMLSLKEGWSYWVNYVHYYGSRQCSLLEAPEEDGKQTSVLLVLKPMKHIRVPMLEDSKDYVQLPDHPTNDNDWLGFRKRYRLFRRYNNWPR